MVLKVSTWTPLPDGPTSASRQACISSRACPVGVMTRISSEGTPSASSCPTRALSTCSTTATYNMCLHVASVAGFL